MQQVIRQLMGQMSESSPQPELDWSFDSIERGRPLRDQVYSLIRLKILTGTLPPGGTLDEKAISGLLGISRTPVREAVQKLSDENLVEIKPQSGTRVALMLRANIHQAYLIRRALENETVAAAAADITPRDLTRLEGNYLQHRLAIEHEEYVEAIRIDDDFHRLIAEIAQLPLLWRAITIFKAQLDRCRYQTVPQKGRGEATLAQHKAVIDALKDRDGQRAQAMMRAHLDRTYAGIEAFLKQDGAG